MTLRSLVILAVVVGLSGCSIHPQKQVWVSGNIESGPKRMSQIEVVAVAQEFAVEHGFSLSDYELPKLSFYQPEQSWSLWFWEKPRGHPGGYFQIEVDDGTGRAELIPSR
jgi:hypothetical protein